MTISATDFQLRVNEYFTKLMQGEEIVIERYGKKFAKLVPYEAASDIKTVPVMTVQPEPAAPAKVESQSPEQNSDNQFTNSELVNIVKTLIKK